MHSVEVVFLELVQQSRPSSMAWCMELKVAKLKKPWGFIFRTRGPVVIEVEVQQPQSKGHSSPGHVMF